MPNEIEPFLVSVAASMLEIPEDTLLEVMHELKMPVLVTADGSKIGAAPFLILRDQFRPKDFYTHGQTARKLKISEARLNRLLSEGEVRAFRVGEWKKYRRRDMNNIDPRTLAPEPPAPEAIYDEPRATFGRPKESREAHVVANEVAEQRNSRRFTIALITLAVLTLVVAIIAFWPKK